MEKNYNRIRLEFNEGMRQSKDRFTWRDSVKDLPYQDRPRKDQLGYNKHFYEIELLDGRVIKIRLDVCDSEDTKFDEDDIRDFVALKLTQEETANLIKTI